MQVTLHTPTPHGTLRAFPSKSEAHRYLICASFADTPTHIACDATNDDIDATAECLCALGTKITRTENGFDIIPITQAPAQADLNVRESGSTLRFLLPIVAALGTHARIARHGRLPERPLAPLDALLAEHGARMENADILDVSGQLSGSEYAIAANISSQFISGLLFALPLLNLETDCTVRLIGQIESRPYLDMTLGALATFGIHVREQDGVLTIPAHSRYRSPGNLIVGGDWSGAAAFACMGAVGPHPITLTGLDPHSAQGDRAVLDVLSRMGAQITVTPTNITVTPAPLHGVEINAAHIPDLVPVLAATAALAKGKTHITGAARLRIKESDRLAATTEVLRTLGADITQTDDGLIIVGKPTLLGGAVQAFGDHRIAMTAAVASLGCTGAVTIDGAQAVAKSYPTFWEQLATLSAPDTVKF